MSVDPIELRKAVELIDTISDQMIEFYDVANFDGEEEELDACFENMAKEPSIAIGFPGECESIDWEIVDFIRQVAEGKSLRVGKLVSLRTENLAIQLVSPASDMANAVLYNQEPMVVETTSRIKVQLQFQSLPVGIEAARIGAWMDDVHGAVTGYIAVEADFTEFEGDRTEQTESDIIDTYLFELAASHRIVFERSSFHSFSEDPPSDWDDFPELKLRPLEEINDGMRLFMAAAQVRDPALRLFSFYKVLEHFGPTVLNLEAQESLRKKLDSREALAPTGAFIRDLLVMSKSFDQRRKEADLLRGVLVTSVELVGINSHVPESFRRAITYETSLKDLDQYARDLAERICATRNQVAHAKAQYELRGIECKPEELAQFADFLEAAAGQVIRWYNRLPDHQKSELA